MEVKCNFGNAVAYSPQSWDWLENREDEDDKLSKRVWKVVETKVEKVRIIEVRGEREKERKIKEVRRERVEEKEK